MALFRWLLDDLGGFSTDERRTFRHEVGPVTFLLAMTVLFLLVALTTPVPA